MARRESSADQELPGPVIRECPLCHNVRRICERSHILPEWMYKPIYSGEHRLKWIQSKGDVFDYDHDTLQKGLREPLLCLEDCEGRLNSYETYAASVFQRE